MKKIIYSLMLIGLAWSAEAQNISKNALGLRFGDNDGFGAEISYQRKLAADNRLELDFGLRSNNNLSFFKAAGLYQWVFNIDGDLNWYVGAGGGFGSYSYSNYYKDRNKFYDNNYGGTYGFLAGDIGIEYDFDFPLLISLDFRPEFVLGDGYGRNYGSDIALSLRYQF
jgi:hypothetical protein